MPPQSRKSPRERKRTDRSLRQEREKTDRELMKTRSRSERDADSVLSTARDRADAVVATARRRADEKAPPRRQVTRERGLEDAVLARERSRADRTLAGERVQRRLLIASLLLAERQTTDRFLRLERTRSDKTITARDQFLGMVVHDVRGLLAGVAMSAELLERDVLSDPIRADRALVHAKRIAETTVHLNRLIGDLLDVTSIERGTLPVSPRHADASSLVREALEVFEPLAEAKGLVVSSEISPEHLPAELDQERVLQVLSNLLGNALKFTPPGGRIEVRVAPRAGELCFAVQDTGPGVPKKQQRAIFERFRQVVRGDKRGLGLGLFISRCIVEAHGGRIWVESAPGKTGSTFQFTIPLAGRHTRIHRRETRNSQAPRS